MQPTSLLTNSFGTTRTKMVARKSLWLISAMALVSAGHGYASNATWNSTSTSANWSDSGNWQAANVPGNTTSGATASTDTASFASAVSNGDGSTNPIVVTSGLTIGSISFDTANVGAYTIGATGGNSLYLSSGGAIQTTSTAANIETINAPLVISGANGTYTFSSNSGTAADEILIGGAISGGTAGNTVLTLAGTNTGTNTISGLISNGSATSLALNLGGAGTWVLSNNSSTYSGGTTISAGTLQVLGGTGTASSGLLGTGTVTLIGGTLSNTDAAAATTIYNSIVAVAGTSSSVTQSGQNFFLYGNLSGSGTLNLTSTSSSSQLSLYGNNAAYAGSITYSAGRSRFGSATAGSNSAAWTMNGGTDGESVNLPAAGTIYFGSVSGSESASRQDGTGLTTINIGALNTSTTSSVVFGATTPANVAMIKVGTGTLAINVAEGLTGGVNVQGGTLALNASGTTVVFPSQALTLSGGTLLDEGGSTGSEVFSGTTIAAGGSSVSTVSGTGTTTGNVLALGALTRSAGGVVNFAPYSTTAAAAGSITTTTNTNTSGIIGGWATTNGGADWATVTGTTPFTIGTYTGYTTLTAAGGGTQTTTNFSLAGSGATTLTGAITANSLKISDAGTGDSLANGGNAITLNGAAGGLLFTGGGSYTISGAGIVGAGSGNEFIANVNSGTLTVSSQIISSTASAGILTKAGAGTLVLSGANNYTGTTYLDGGVLSLGNASALGSTNTITFAGGTLQFTSTNHADISAKIGNSTAAASFDLNGQTVSFGTGINSTYTSSSNSFTGNVGGLTVNDTSVGSAGVLTLSGTNSYIGTTTLNNGTLVTSANNALGNQNGFYWDQLTVNSGTLNLGGTTQNVGVVNLNGGTIAGTGTLAGLAFNANNTTQTTVNAVLSNNGASSAVGVGLTKTGSGTLVLANADTFAGETTISAGAVQENNASALQYSVVSIGATNGLLFNTGVDTVGIGGLAGSSNEALTDLSSNAVNLTVGNNNYIGASYSGVLSGATSSLTKTGTNTQTLSGAANTYGGGTTINGGVLSVAGNLSLGVSTSTVTINSGTLATTALITDTHVINIGANGGTIQGVSGGQLILNTANTLTGSGTLTIDANGVLTGTTGVGNIHASAANSYSGNLVLNNGGQFEYGIGGAIGSAATVTIGNEGEFEIDSSVNATNNITINGGTNSILDFNTGGGTAATYSGVLTLSQNGIVSLQNWFNTSVGSGTITGQITGAGALTVNSGSGTAGNLTLTNASNNYTGATTITSSTVTLASGGVLGGGSYSGSITLGGATAALVDNSTAGQVLSGVISGTGAVSKTGSATLTLSGANTYTGSTTLSTGTLVLANTSALGATTNTLEISGAATVALQTDAGFGGTNPLYNVTIGFTQGSGAYADTFALGRATAGASNSITHNFGTLIMSLFGGTNGNLIVTAGTNATTGTDTLAFTGLLAGNGLPATETLTPTGGNLTFGTVSADQTGTVTVDLDGTTSGNAITGAITNGGGGVILIKTNTSTWALSGNNTFTGGFTLTNGTIDVNSATALGATGTIALNGGTIDNTNGGTTLTNNQAITIGGNFAFGGTNNLNLGTGAVSGSTTETITLGGSAKTLTLGGTWTNTVDAANTLTVNGASNTLALGGLALDGSGTTARTQTIGGSGNVTVGQITNGASTGTQSLVYAGTGTLTVNGSAASTYLGSTTVSSGMLVLNEANVAGTANILSSTSTLTLGSGLTITGGSQTFASIGLTSGTADTIVLGSSGASLTSTAALSGGGNASLFLNLVSAGTGTFNTNLAASTILPWSIVQDSTGVGIGTTNATKDLVRLTATPLSATSNSASTNYTTTGSTNNGGTGTVTNTVGTATLNTVFVDAGTTSSGTTTTWDLGSATNTITLASGDVGMDGPNNFTIQDGNIKGGQATTSSLTLNSAGTGTLTVSANIVNGNGNSTLTTYGNILLSGANTFTGSTTIDGGTVKAGDSTIQGTSGALGTGNGNLAVNGSGLFDLNGYNVGVGGLSGTGTLTNSSATTATLTLGNNNAGFNSGVALTDGSTAGSLAIVKTGNGTWQQDVAITSTGGITVNTAGGELYAGVENAFGTQSELITLNASTNVYASSLATGDFANNFQLNNGSVLTVISDRSQSFTGNITGGSNTGLYFAETVHSGNINLSGNNSGFTGTLTFDESSDSTAGFNLDLNTYTSGGIGATWVFAIPGSNNYANAGIHLNASGTGTYSVAELISPSGTGTITETSGTTPTLQIGDSTSNTPSYGGAIVGTGLNLTKTGTDTQTLTGTNSYTGSTTVSGGGLVLSGTGSLTGTTAIGVSTGATFTEGSTSGVGAATYNVSGTANLNGANASVTTSTITSSGVINLGNGTANGSLTGSITDNGLFAVNGGTTAESIANAITGTGSVTLASASTGSLSFGQSSTNLNGYSGGTTVTSGSWTAPSAGAFGTGNLTITPTSNTVVTTFASSAGTLGSGATVTVNNGTGGVTGQLVLNDVAQTIAGLNGNGSLVLNGGGGTLLTIGNNNASGTFSGVISDANSGDSSSGGAIVKIGTGTLTLSGSNTFDNNGGTLGGGTGTAYSTEVAGGVLNIQNGRALGYDVNGTNGYDTTYSGSNLAKVDGGATLQMQGGITVTANPLTISGSGAAGATGALENVSGNNAYDAGITLAGNTTFASDAGTLTVNSTANSGVPNPGVLGGTGNLTLVGAGNGNIQDAIQTGSSSLTMNSTGTWTLGGVNTYTGSTTLNSGTTIINGSTAAGSTVTVGDATATLMGTGTINGPLVTTANGIIAPGASAGAVGTLHVGSLGFTIGAGTNFDYDVNTNNALASNDLINMNGGTLTVGGSGIVFNFNQVSAFTTGEAYTLIDGASSVSGFSASDFSATGLGSDTATFALSGDNLIVTFNSPNTGNYYYNGSTSSDFTNYNNYYQTISGTTQTQALSSTSNVFLSANSPSNNAPVVNSNVSINSLTFNGNGAGSSLTGTGTVTIAASGGTGVTDSSGGTTTETIGAAVALGSSQSWSVANSGNTLNVTGAISGPQSLALTGSGTYELGGANTFQGLTVGTGSDKPTVLLTNGSSGSATGTTTLAVNAGATIGGYGTSSGTSFNVAGSGTTTATRANILVGLNSTSDTNTSQVLALIGSSTSTITNANLTFNLSVSTHGALGSDPSGSGTELSIGNTKLTLGSGQGSVLFTLNMQNEPGIVTAYTPYVLIAGTLPTSGGGVDGSQYTGLTLGNVLVSTGTVTETIISGNNLALAFGDSTDQSYYGTNSYLVLYQNTVTGADDIDVVVVPEPGTWALMLGGLAFLVFWQRRRNKTQR